MRTPDDDRAHARDLGALAQAALRAMELAGRARFASDGPPAC